MSERFPNARAAAEVAIDSARAATGRHRLPGMLMMADIAEALLGELTDALQQLNDERLANLRLMREGKNLVASAKSLERNVMGNGLAYRREALRDTIGQFELQLERSAGRPTALKE